MQAELKQTLKRNKVSRYTHKNLIVEVIDEPTYKYGSADNNFSYSRHYFSNKAEAYPTSKHGIKVYCDNQIIYNSIVIGSGGATGISQNSSLIDNDQLLVCCSDTIFCLTLPELGLKWKTCADQATCFQVFKQQDFYIVHGELQVTRLDKNGQIVWAFGGADIFVSIDNEEVFKVENDGILLADFGKTIYKLDFNGKLIWHTCKQ